MYEPKHDKPYLLTGTVNEDSNQPASAKSDKSLRCPNKET